MVDRVINAAGKLTALGGSAQAAAVAEAQAQAASRHVDLAQMRREAGERIANLTGAEAACITSGAAAGIVISVAAVLTGTNLDRVMQLPDTDECNNILLQAGHAVNFGATVEQMIRLGGGFPWIVGSSNSVSAQLLADTLDNDEFAALVYVQSHHSVQENMVSLPKCIELCRQHDIPVIVDAAAEEDLRKFIELGADLVTYSGGKAIGGPTVGFIAGKAALIEACEMQFRGIARPMKVGKEAIAGLLAALDTFVNADPATRAAELDEVNQRIVDGLGDCGHLSVSLKPDEAGRAFQRVSVGSATGSFDVHDLADYLADASPSIRTRNHHLDQGILLIDPRELKSDDVDIIIDRLKSWNTSLQ